jgi:solute carrier family 25 folate transporter 32
MLSWTLVFYFSLFFDPTDCAPQPHLTGSGRKMSPSASSTLQESKPYTSSSSSSSSSSLPTKISITEESKRQIVHDPAYFYASLIAGVGSGALPSVLCAPLDLIRTQMQVYGAVLQGRGRGSSKIIPTMMKDIWQREGFKGFFRGLGATLLTVPVFWGVYFPLYEDLKRRWSSHSPSTNLSVVHMGSAVGAGIVADVICNPMFVIRTRLQTEALHDAVTGKFAHKPTTIINTAQSLFREGGGRIFWRGMTANLLGLSHVAIQFPIYEQLKLSLRGDKHRESIVDILLATSLSKMSASLISYPHEVIRSRMMDSRVNVGFFKTCSTILAQEGLLGFYTGLQVTMIRVIPNTCVTFLSYELVLRWARAQIDERRRKGLQ